MASFYGSGSIASRLEPLQGGSLLFTKLPKNCWYSFYQPRKNERLSQPWSLPMVLTQTPGLRIQYLNQQAIEVTEEATKIAANIYIYIYIYINYLYKLYIYIYIYHLYVKQNTILEQQKLRLKQGIITTKSPLSIACMKRKHNSQNIYGN